MYCTNKVQHAAHLDHTVHSLCIHEMILHWVLWDLLRVAENSLLDDKPGVSCSHGLCVACTAGHCGVACHYHGGALIPRAERKKKWGEEEGKEEAGREWKTKRRVGNGQGGEEDKMGKEVERRKGR